MEVAEATLRAAETAPDLDGAIAAATDAVTRFRAALDLAPGGLAPGGLAPEARAPLDWAETQTRLSAALRLLGALLDDVDLLHDAIRSAQAALSVAPLATAPQVWGRARAALGSVYVVLGERDGDLATLAEAAANYAEALEGFPRVAFPLDWARMLRNRGAALALAAEAGNDPDALHDAIGCYRAALEVYSPAATPAAAGLAASAPADRAPADRALADRALADWALADPAMADRVRADWALTQSNLGQALRLLGERSGDTPDGTPNGAPDGTPNGTHHLHEAVAACEAALAATARDAAPEERAMVTTNLANALAALGERAGDPDSLRRAIDAYRQALAALGGPRWLRQRAIARHNLRLAEQRLAALQADAP
jgi:tetratricopeptide (TPR) repeat protein